MIRTSAARNSLVGIEHLTDEELEDIRAEAEKAGDESVERMGYRAEAAEEKAVS